MIIHCRCKLKNLVGVILSREVHVKAGEFAVIKNHWNDLS
jgi:hypothetical protein